jgi:hypothetical protein
LLLGATDRVLARISHTHYDSCIIASRSIALSN